MASVPLLTNEPEPGRAEQVLQLVREAGLLRSRDLAARGISPTHLQRLYEQGLLERSGRGVYFAPEIVAAQGENLSLAEVALRVPHAIICLVSALRFHDLTTQTPHKVWIALPTRAHVPFLDYPAVCVVRMGKEPFQAGIEEKNVGGSIIRVYNVAKTVADCFKFRNRVGLDVALEALKDSLRKKAATMDDLWHYAKICRVANVMRPYLESVVAQ